MKQEGGNGFKLGLPADLGYESKSPLMVTSNDNRRAVVILGMHRSGTSALAGTLHHLGVEFGRDLIGASPSNPKGHFEMTAAVHMNDHLLRRVFGTRWKLPFQLPLDWPSRVDIAGLAKTYEITLPTAPLFGLKDPRMCRLVPIWRSFLEMETTLPPRFVLMLRRPEEVAHSLNKRDGIEVKDGLRLWREHVAASEQTTRDAERLILTYEQLLADPLSTVDALTRFLEIPPPRSPDEILSFLDPHLRHHGASGRDASRSNPFLSNSNTGPLDTHPPKVATAHEVYAAAAADGNSPRFSELVDALRIDQ